MAIKCGNCKEYHPNVQAVRGCHLAAGKIDRARIDLSKVEAEVEPPLDDPWGIESNEDTARRVKQNFLDEEPEERVMLKVPFSEKDIAKREIGAKWDPKAKSWWVPRSTLDTKDVPTRWLPSVDFEAPEPITEDGIYRFNGVIYKIQWNQERSRLYGKRLVVGTEVEPVWTYEPGVLSMIAGAEKLTLEEAQQFGHMYGQCIVCGRTLSNESSIAAGIGPICAQKFG